jgi:hypothetical protein
MGVRTAFGMALVTVSTGLWLGVFAIPFLPLSFGAAWLLAGGLFVAGEALFWLGVLVVGPDLVRWIWRWVPWRRQRLGGTSDRAERARLPGG